MRRQLIAFFLVTLSLCSSTLAHAESSPTTAASHPSLMLLVDKSRSMADAGRLEMVKAGIEKFVASIPVDSVNVGLMGFDSAPFYVARMQLLNEEAKETLLRRTKLLFPTGKRSIVPAFDFARRQIRGPGVMVIVSDGLLREEERDVISSMAREASAVGVSVSSIALGKAGVSGLTMIADAGKGASRECRKAEEVEAFLNDVLAKMMK